MISVDIPHRKSNGPFCLSFVHARGGKKYRVTGARNDVKSYIKDHFPFSIVHSIYYCVYKPFSYSNNPFAKYKYSSWWSPDHRVIINKKTGKRGESGIESRDHFRISYFDKTDNKKKSFCVRRVPARWLKRYDNACERFVEFG